MQSCYLSAANNQSQDKSGQLTNQGLTVTQSSQNNSNVPYRDWQRAEYKGLRIGTSTLEDMLRLLGNPRRVEQATKSGKNISAIASWYVYEGTEWVPGELKVVVDNNSKRINFVVFYPNNLTREEAVNYFGADYLIKRYDFCDEQSENEEAGPIYESPDGTLEYIEYRSRGMALWLSNTNKVQEIIYDDKPLGVESKDKCKDDQ
jgi:hypothetical protein